MLLAPLGLKGHSPCFLVTPNGGSYVGLISRIPARKMLTDTVFLSTFSGRKDGSQNPMESAHIKWAQFGSCMDSAYINYICTGYTLGKSK